MYGFFRSSTGVTPHADRAERGRPATGSADTVSAAAGTGLPFQEQLCSAAGDTESLNIPSTSKFPADAISRMGSTKGVLGWGREAPEGLLKGLGGFATVSSKEKRIQPRGAAFEHATIKRASLTHPKEADERTEQELKQVLSRNFRAYRRQAK